MKVIIALFLAVTVAEATYSSRELRCSVCEVVIKEMEKEISKVNPNKKINLSHRIDGGGKVMERSKPFARSEIHLTEVMDSICEKMENYVRAYHKETKKFKIVSLAPDSGGMDPEFWNYDIIQDSDLNKSVKFNCEGILDEFDSEIMNVLQEETRNPVEKVCVEATQLCDNTSEKRNVEL